MMRIVISWLGFIAVLLSITVPPAWAVDIKEGLILYFNFDKAQGDTVKDRTYAQVHRTLLLLAF